MASILHAVLHKGLAKLVFYIDSRSDVPLGDVEIPLHEIEREGTHSDATHIDKGRAAGENDPKLKWRRRWMALDNVKKGELQVTVRRAPITSPEMRGVLEVRYVVLVVYDCLR